MSLTIETRIAIDAPAKTVWSVLVDLDAYAQWNPFIVNAKGVIAEGETLFCEPRMPGGRQYTFTPTVTRCVEGSEFAWTGFVLHPKIACGEHIFRIEELGDERVILLHDEVFSGLLAPLVMRFSGRSTEQGFVLMNEAVKQRAEALAPH